MSKDNFLTGEYDKDKPYGLDNPVYDVSDDDLQLIKQLIAEGHKVEFEPFVDGIGQAMWGVSNCWDYTLRGAYEFYKRKHEGIDK